MVNDLLRWDCNFEIFFSFLIGQRSNWRKKLDKLFKQWVLCVGVNCVLFLDLLNAGWKTACFNDVKVYLLSRSPDVFHSLFNLGTAPTEWWRRYVLSWFFFLLFFLVFVILESFASCAKEEVWLLRSSLGKPDQNLGDDQTATLNTEVRL